jgi:adenylate cyclase
MDRAEVPLLIAFADLTEFAVHSLRLPDVELADTLDLYYRSVVATIEHAGGRVVKFIGDGVLIVFPEETLDRGVRGLLELKKAVDDLMEARGWTCRLIIKAHFGEVMAGPFGPSEAFDIIGKNVNAAARLKSKGVTLSAAAYEKLSPETQKRFRQQALPAIYVRSED